jgi:hypothetical protein
MHCLLTDKQLAVLSNSTAGAFLECRTAPARGKKSSPFVLDLSTPKAPSHSSQHLTRLALPPIGETHPRR